MKKNINHASREHSRISPSGLNSLRQCPGYESDDSRSSEAADRGTLLHEAMDSGIIPENLSESDKIVAARTLEVVYEADSRSYYDPLKEISLDFKSLGLQDFERGHADRIIVLQANERDEPIEIELIDFKFGSWAVEQLSDNLQFHAYAVGAFLMFPTLKTVCLRLIQPALDVDVSLQISRERDYEVAVTRISAVVKRRHKWLETSDNTMLRPSSTICQFCARQAECQPWQEYSAKLAKEANLFGHDIVPVDAFGSLETADPEKVLQAFKWVRPMEEYLRKFKKFVLATVDAGRLDHGVKLVEKGGVASVVDMLRVSEILQEHGVDANDFLAACSISMTSLKALISEAAPNNKKAAVERVMQQLTSEGLLQAGAPIRYVQFSASK